MKLKSIYIFLLVSLFFSFTSGSKTLPSVTITTLDGATINTSSFTKTGKPMIINFWATWCSPCKAELSNMAEVYDMWQKETGVKIIAVSIDDARNKHKVKPYVEAKGWRYDFYLDEEQVFMKALSIQNPPHTLLLNGKGEIVYEHNGYSPGDEKELYTKLKNLSN